MPYRTAIKWGSDFLSEWKHVGHTYGGMFWGVDTLVRNAIAISSTAVGCYLTRYWNDAPEMFHDAAVAAGGFYLIDWITGATLAGLRDCFTSKGLRKGIYKFIAYASSVLAAGGIDILVRGEQEYFLSTAMLVIIALNELSSIRENTEKLGFRWPNWFSGVIDKFRQQWEDRVVEENMTNVGRPESTDSPKDEDGACQT